MRALLWTVFVFLSFVVVHGAAQEHVSGETTKPTVILTDGIEISRDQVQITPKAEYVHVLFDAFPYRSKIKAKGRFFSLETFVAGLLRKTVLIDLPATKRIKVDVVEYPERDDYGAPRIDSVSVLATFDFPVMKGKLKPAIRKPKQ